MRGDEPAHVVRRISGPALAANVVVEPAVAVGHDVEAGKLLIAQIAGERVLVLLAEAAADHGFETMPVPRFSVYQLGRGSEPVIVVGNMMSLGAPETWRIASQIFARARAARLSRRELSNAMWDDDRRSAASARCQMTYRSADGRKWAASDALGPGKHRLALFHEGGAAFVVVAAGKARLHHFDRARDVALALRP